MVDRMERFRKGILVSARSVEKDRFKCIRHRRQHPDKHPECRFCQKISSKKDILLENNHIVVMFGRLHHKGHLVILPKCHEEDLMKLHKSTLDSFMNDTILVMKALGKAIRPDMFNLEYLDNWDHHVHWNVYPRFKKDKDWGDPPVIPGKDEKFRPKTLTKQEMKIFKAELAKIKKELW